MDQIGVRTPRLPVPVAVYVWRPAGRAPSITMAAHAAAMAPGTHIGAAHPATRGGMCDGGEGPQ